MEGSCREASGCSPVMPERYDVIIIGGGGGTLAHRLAPSGKKDPDPGATRLAATRSVQPVPRALCCYDERSRLRLRPMHSLPDLQRVFVSRARQVRRGGDRGSPCA